MGAGPDLQTDLRPVVLLALQTGAGGPVTPLGSHPARGQLPSFCPASEKAATAGSKAGSLSPRTQAKSSVRGPHKSGDQELRSGGEATAR